MCARMQAGKKDRLKEPRAQDGRPRGREGVREMKTVRKVIAVTVMTVALGAGLASAGHAQAPQTPPTQSTMWWVVADMANIVSGPSGHRVRMWIGPWDTKTMCEGVRTSFQQSMGKDETVMNVHCQQAEGGI
jgi:hypothetical protein